MNGNNCRVTRREIDQSELNATLSDQATAHVGACSACREFRDERTRLRQMIGSLEPVTAPANFDLRLRARIAAEGQGAARQPFFAGFALSTPAMAVAALLVVSLASVVWFVEHKRNSSTTAAASPSTKERAQETPPRESDQKLAISITPGNETPGPNPGNKGGRKPFGANSKRNQTVNASDLLNRSRDFGVGPQPVYKQMVDQIGQVSLTAPDKPLVFSMQDARGTRRISLPPVSFGSQRLVDNRIPVSQTSARIW
jgi:hypothetical protein